MKIERNYKAEPILGLMYFTVFAFGFYGSLEPCIDLRKMISADSDSFNYVSNASIFLMHLSGLLASAIGIVTSILIILSSKSSYPILFGISIFTIGEIVYKMIAQRYDSFSDGWLIIMFISLSAAGALILGGRLNSRAKWVILSLITFIILTIALIIEDYSRGHYH